MTMTRDDSFLMDKLMADETPDQDRDMVHHAGDAVIEHFRSAGIKVLQDDNRAALDAAIYRYLLRCKEAHGK